MLWIRAMWWGERRERLGVADHIGGDVVDLRTWKCIFVERQEIGVVIDFDGETVLGPVICHGNLPALGPKLLLVWLSMPTVSAATCPITNQLLDEPISPQVKACEKNLNYF